MWDIILTTKSSESATNTARGVREILNVRNDIRGFSENPVDSKGRVSCPTTFRTALSDENLVVTRSNDEDFPHLRLYAEADYYAFIDRYFEGEGGYNDSLQNHQRRLAALVRGATPVKIDASYRITLPQELREYAHITDRVRFNGLLDHVQIIAPEVDDKYIGVDLYPNG